MSQAAADFDADVVPGISATPLGHLAAGGYLDAGEPVVLLGDWGTGEILLDDDAAGPVNGNALRP